jgi:uncharacterized protein YjiS (DUF1127 family)
MALDVPASCSDETTPGDVPMDAIYNVVELTQTLPTRLGLTFLKSTWGALLEWRERFRLRARLYDLSDRELHDIGITRGEVDYVASNRAIDPCVYREPRPS